MIKVIAFDLVGVLIRDNEEIEISINLLKELKKRYPNIKLLIATNYGAAIREKINEIFGSDYLDDLIISGEIMKYKPKSDFYEYILEKHNIKAKELLFLDDSFINVESAKKLGINSYKIEEDTNIFELVIKYLEEK